MNIEFHLIVPENQQALYEEWQRALDEEVPITIRSQFHFVRSMLHDLPGTRFDAIVSPANSYGRMDGAFDAAIARLLTPSVHYRINALTSHVQKALYSRWRGFAPAGTATIVQLPTNISDVQIPTTGCKHVIVCPTMHFPRDISWNLDIVYNTVWSLLAEVDRYNRKKEAKLEQDDKIRSILMSGLGTGTGKLSIQRFTMQFALAIKNFDEAVRKPEKWSSLEWEDVGGTISEYVYFTAEIKPGRMVEMWIAWYEH